MTPHSVQPRPALRVQVRQCPAACQDWRPATIIRTYAIAALRLTVLEATCGMNGWYTTDTIHD